MSRYRKYQDKDVLTAALERMRHIYDCFDSVSVSYSGGKDSLVVLALAKQVAEERGRLPVNATFNDEEIIPDTIVRFVDEYRQMDWLRLRWFAVPLRNERFVLGKRREYVAWDSGREWVRPKPPWAETSLSEIGDRIPDQHELDDAIVAPLPGKVAILTGIRAAESMMRLAGCLIKLNECYITGSDNKRANYCKPIYDWSENDVLKFFMDRRIRYCSLYDHQHLVGAKLRVSTPLHAESAKHISLWKELDPEFYDRILKVFPQTVLQERYWNEWDSEAVVRKYEGQGFAGCQRFIDDNITDDSMRRIALDTLEKFKRYYVTSPDLYGPDYLLRQMSSGRIEGMLPNYNGR